MTVGGVLIVMSGLPAAGKSTIGRAISERLNIGLIDKDDILEGLFEERQAGPERRSELSRTADEIFLAELAQLASAVAVSFWRHPRLPGPSGSPIDRLPARRATLEIWCDCSPTVALERFFARHRHPAHGDDTRDRRATAAQFQFLADLGPLGLGHLIRVRTSTSIDLDALTDEVVAVLGVDR